MPLVNLDEPLAHEDACASNPRRLNVAVCLLGPNQENTRAPHLYSLRDAVAKSTARRSTVVRQQSSDRAAGASRRWVLRDATQGRKHASTNVNTVSSPRVQIDGGSNVLAKDGLHSGGVDASPFERGTVPKFRHQKWEADRGYLRLMRLGHDILRGERDCGGQEPCGNAFPQGERLRRGQLARRNFPLPHLDSDRDQPRLLLERHGERRPNLSKFPGAGENERRSYVGMASERHLSRWGKDPDPPRMPSLRGEHKRGLREVELARDLLHLIVGQAVRTRQYGQGIPAEACLCKHVTWVISILHERLSNPPKVRGGQSR